MNLPISTTSSNPAADAAMDRYAGGDDSAFVELYAALAPKLATFVAGKLHDCVDVPDIVQETMLRIHAARFRFVRGSWVTPWACAIARRIFIDRRRRSRREAQIFDRDVPIDQLAGRQGPDEILHTTRNGRIVLRAVSRLPVTQREAYHLVYFAEMSHAEAAQRLGVTAASIKLRVHRANRSIRAVCEAGQSTLRRPAGHCEMHSFHPKATVT